MDFAVAGLNRTFYGIETRLFLPFRLALAAVLIVPFMELKPLIVNVYTISFWSLNRTFYGIETQK